jgi:hypothetical protein
METELLCLVDLSLNNLNISKIICDYAIQRSLVDLSWYLQHLEDSAAYWFSPASRNTSVFQFRALAACALPFNQWALLLELFEKKVEKLDYLVVVDQRTNPLSAPCSSSSISTSTCQRSVFSDTDQKKWILLPDQQTRFVNFRMEVVFVPSLTRFFVLRTPKFVDIVSFENFTLCYHERIQPRSPAGLIKNIQVNLTSWRCVVIQEDVPGQQILLDSYDSRQRLEDSMSLSCLRCKQHVIQDSVVWHLEASGSIRKGNNAIPSFSLTENQKRKNSSRLILWDYTYYVLASLLWYDLGIWLEIYTLHGDRLQRKWIRYEDIPFCPPASVQLGFADVTGLMLFLKDTSRCMFVNTKG